LRTVVLLVVIILRLPTPTLFPYTTLFRSDLAAIVNWHERANAPDAIFCTHTSGDVPSGVFSGRSATYHCGRACSGAVAAGGGPGDRKSTRLNSSHEWISYAVFCLKKKIER